MAIMSPPSVDGIKDITLGELAVFNYLKASLPDSHYVWYDTMVNNVNPDFVILGPELGVVVLEVKDWDIRSIEKADANTFQLRGLRKSLVNPLNQARNYSRKIAEELEGNQGLRQLTGKYAGRLKLNFGYAVVFSKITEADFKNSPHGRSIPAEYLLFKDDLINSDVTHLFKKLLGSVPGGNNFTQLDSQDVEVIQSIIAREPIPDIKSTGQAEATTLAKKTPSEAIEAQLSIEESVIYKNLKVWRSRKAAQLNYPAYAVATNQNLLDIIMAHPTREDDLLSIKGFGQERKEKYGRDIIQILAGQSNESTTKDTTESGYPRAQGHGAKLEDHPQQNPTLSPTGLHPGKRALIHSDTRDHTHGVGLTKEGSRGLPTKNKNYLYRIGAGVLCLCIAVGAFGGYYRKQSPSTPKSLMSVAQATVTEKVQAPGLASKVASEPRLPEKADTKPRDVSHVKQTSSPSTPVPPAESVKKPIEGIWIKGNIREDGSKVYHMPGQKYYSATNPEEWFETEQEAINAGYKKAKDMEGRKPVEGVWIKGNISADGDKIYHMPGQEYYSKVIPEAWFETAEDATKAGFRKSKR